YAAALDLEILPRMTAGLDERVQHLVPHNLPIHHRSSSQYDRVALLVPEARYAAARGHRYHTGYLIPADTHKFTGAPGAFLHHVPPQAILNWRVEWYRSTWQVGLSCQSARRQQEEREEKYPDHVDRGMSYHHAGAGSGTRELRFPRPRCGFRTLLSRTSPKADPLPTRAAPECSLSPRPGLTPLPLPPSQAAIPVAT